MPSSLSSKLQHVVNLAKWIPQAKTLDTVDSPYLVDFVKEVVKTPLENSKEIENIEGIRHRLLADATTIKNIDFGSGSNVYQRQRTIAQVAKSSLSNKSKCNLLARISRYYRPPSILELGSCLGISAYYLSAVCAEAKITSIEGHPDYHDICESNKPLWANNIEFQLGQFHTSLQELVDKEKKYDLIFIDGSHSAAAQDELWPQYESLAHDKTTFILDDIYWSADMQSWWKGKKKNGRFNVAIDLYHFGILSNDTAIKESIDVKVFPKNWRWQLGVRR